MTAGGVPRLPVDPSSRDAQHVLRKTRNYGMVSRDPDNPVEGYLWIRQDISPPELRVQVDGTKYKVAFTAV